MNAKEIGRRAGRIFEYHLPDNWIFRSQEDQEDYGIDGEIELTNSSDNATGFIFKAQIKGQKRLSIINNNTVVSFSLNTERLKYYIDQIEIPVILIVVDISSKLSYWKSLQDDEALRKKIKKSIKNKTASTSIHIPVNNCLPGTEDELLSSVEENMNWLRASALNRMTAPIERMIKNKTTHSLDEMLEQTKSLNFHIYSENFERLFVKGEFDELFELGKKVIASATEKTATRFCAGLYIERCYLERFHSDASALQELNFNLYAYLIEVVRSGKGELYLRQYAILLMRSIRLSIAVEIDYHHFISAKMLENDHLTKWVVEYSRAQIVLRAAREVEKVIHLTNRIMLSGNVYTILDTLPRVCPRLALFAHRLEMDGLHKQSNILYSWIDFCIEYGIKYAQGLEEENFIAEMLVLNASYKASHKDAIVKIDETYELAKKINDNSIRNSVIETVSKMRARHHQKDENSTPEDEIKFFRDRAKALGMNPDDPENEFGKIIKQGLIDYNPERVLKNCKHLLVFPSNARGIPARMVGIPTAAMKWIYCTKKGYAAGGWALDEIYDSSIPKFSFKEQYCKNCSEKCPRDESWKWSSSWQNAQLSKHQDIITKIDSSI